MARRVKPEALASAVGQDLRQYSTETSDKLRKSVKTAMTRLVKTTKGTAPVGRRKDHYKDHIRSQTVESSPLREVRRWYVDSDGGHYRLTHLLDKGHRIHNNRHGRRYGGTRFVTNAESDVRQRHQKDVEAILNGR